MRKSSPNLGCSERKGPSTTRLYWWKVPVAVKGTKANTKRILRQLECRSTIEKSQSIMRGEQVRVLPRVMYILDTWMCFLACTGYKNRLGFLSASEKWVKSPLWGRRNSANTLWRGPTNFNRLTRALRSRLYGSQAIREGAGAHTGGCRGHSKGVEHLGA